MTGTTNGVTAIPAFNDNYIWAICHDGKCTVVDPGDAAPVTSFLEARRLTLHSILITHHHADHTGGLSRLLAAYDVPVFGPAGGHIAGISHAVGEGDRVTIVGGSELEVLTVPGHTLDHIAYVGTLAYAPDTPVLFCGDTLFAAGCGRIFEGTAEMMYRSLQRLAALDPATRVYCAHEYTLNNLKFAHMAEPDNEAVAQRIVAESDKRQRQLPTLPSTIGMELRTNPFLRCHSDSLKSRVQQQTNASADTELNIFASLRTWKDNA